MTEKTERMTWEQLEVFIAERLSMPANRWFFSSSGSFFYSGFAEIMPEDAIVYARPTVNGREMLKVSPKLANLIEKVCKEKTGRSYWNPFGG